VHSSDSAVSWVTVFSKRLGISTERLSGKAEFGVLRDEPSCMEDSSHWWYLVVFV